MLQLLEKVRYSIAALVIGSVFVALGYYRVVDVKPLRVSSLARPNAVLLGIGIAMLAVSVGAGILSQFGDALWLPSFARRVKKTDAGWCTQFGGATIRVVLGRIEEVAKPLPNALVVLPANEFFDDECITDRGSALGAFVAHHFATQTSHLLDLLSERLKPLPTTDVERARGVRKASYGVGATAFLSRVLGTSWNLMLGAATTQRAGEGLRAEIRTIFTLADAIEGTMADHRLTDVTLPLIGSGHGGLRKPAALSALLVAFVEVLRRPAGHGIKNVSIVIYQGGPKDPPEINARLVRRTMARVLDLYAT